MHTSTNAPFLGFGLGLRPEYYQQTLDEKPPIDWFEITSENYLIPGGKPLYFLEKFRENYPLVMHGVSMSIGSSDALDWDYLQQLKQLANRIEPAWISDHLCWTGVGGVNMHDLLPLPYTQQAIDHMVSRIMSIQEFLGRPIAVENVSSYLTYKQSTMHEWEFVREIVTRSGCYLLLDVNNIYVSAINHNFSPVDYIKGLPLNKVVQIHLAGHSNNGSYIIDTHDAPIIPEVWQIYKQAWSRFGAVSTMIERDDNMPALAELINELNYARTVAQNTIETGALA